MKVANVIFFTPVNSEYLYCIITAIGDIKNVYLMVLLGNCEWSYLFRDLRTNV